MAFTFPADKADFTAPNGITYSWDTDDEKWVVATFGGEHEHQDLENAVELAQNGVDANALLIQNNTDDIAAIPNDYYNKSEIDIQQQAQDNRIEELEISKGKVARYITDNTVGTPVSRPGELAVNSASPSSVTVVSLGVEDADNVLTKPMADGDIIEFVDAVSGKISRYKINDASAAPTVVTVEHISGNNDFANGEEEQVYIYPQNEAGASQSYVDAQDALLQDQITEKLTKTGDTVTGELLFGGEGYIKGSDSGILSGRASLQISGHSNLPIVVTSGSSYAAALAIYGYDSGSADKRKESICFYANGDIKARKANFAGEVLLNGGDDIDNLSIYPNVGNDDSVITALNCGALRFRTSPGNHSDAGKKTHIAIEQDDTGVATTHIYHVATPINPDDAVNKSYCDSMSGGGVPVGSIMIWMNTTAPAGWLKLQGGSFDVAQYSKLHAYLEGTANYTSGKLPDWGGYYPGEWGSHLNDSLGKKVGQKTAMPSGGAPYHANSIPNGNTRTFNGGGGTNAYSNGAARPAITEGWDSYTRPQTVIVHYIIKHD